MMNTLSLKPKQDTPAAVERLRDRCLSGLGPGATDSEKLRLDSEFELIAAAGEAEAFLGIGRIAEQARKRDHRMYVRGIPGGCLVMHALGLYPLNPLYYGLLAEPFLKPIPRRGSLEIAVVSTESAAEAIAEDLDFAKLGTGEATVPSSRYEHRISFLNHPLLDATARLIGAESQESRDIPLNDPKTFAALKADEDWKSAGCVIDDPNETVFSALIFAYGAMFQEESSVAQVIERARNTRMPPGFPAIFRSVTRDTRGLIIFDEQIMHLLLQLGNIPPEIGYLYGKARALNRKKHRAGLLPEFEVPDNDGLIDPVATVKTAFLATATRILPENIAEELYQLIHNAARKSFSKAQAALAAYLCYRWAYFKVHSQK